MKKIFLILLMVFSVNLFAQRELGVEDRTKENAVFGGDGEKACVTITAPTNFRPLFVSQENIVKPSKIDTLNDINYHFVFDASVGRNRRELTVNVKGFTPYVFKWYLNPKQQLNYSIFDPDSTVLDCYYELNKEGLALFKNAMYNEAKKKYELSKECYRIPTNADVYEKIAVIDSILAWHEAAKMYEYAEDESAAIEYYLKIRAANPEDKRVVERISELNKMARTKCSLLFSRAERFYKEKDYDEAERLYEKVVSEQCYNSSVANAKLQEIQEIRKKKNQLSRVLTYELMKNAPIGFSIGGYKEHKASGYFTLRLNSDVLEMSRSNYVAGSKPELNISFGWTIKIVKPVWIFFGPGYTGICEYKYEEEDVNKEDDPTLKFHSAISPELGLLAKIKISPKIGIALRYTFQYRFAFEKEMENYIGKNRSVFGIGICF